MQDEPEWNDTKLEDDLGRCQKDEFRDAEREEIAWEKSRGKNTTE